MENKSYFDEVDYLTIAAHKGLSVGFNHKLMKEKDLYQNIIGPYKKELQYAKGILVNLTTKMKIGSDALNKALKNIANDECEIIVSVNNKTTIECHDIIASLYITGLKEKKVFNSLIDGTSTKVNYAINILKSKEFNLDCEYSIQDTKAQLNIYKGTSQESLITLKISDIDDMTIKYHDDKFLESKMRFHNKICVLKNVLLEYIGDFLLKKYYYPICENLNIRFHFNNSLSDFEKITTLQNKLKYKI